MLDWCLGFAIDWFDCVLWFIVWIVWLMRLFAGDWLLIVLVFVIRIYSYLLICLVLVRIVSGCGFFWCGVCLFAVTCGLLYCLRFVGLQFVCLQLVIVCMIAPCGGF